MPPTSDRPQAPQAPPAPPREQPIVVRCTDCHSIYGLMLSRPVDDDELAEVASNCPICNKGGMPVVANEDDLDDDKTI